MKNKFGQSYEMNRIFTQEEVLNFVSLSLDTNLLHTDVEFAKNTQFGRLIVPGFLTAFLFSAIIGTKFPGLGSIYLKQEMSFVKSVFLEQMVKALVKVVALIPEKHSVMLSICCYNGDNQLIIRGNTLVKLP